MGRSTHGCCCGFKLGRARLGVERTGEGFSRAEGSLLVTSSFSKAGLHSIWVNRTYPLSVEVVIVITLEDFLNCLFILEDDKPETTGPHSLVIVYNISFNNSPELLEIAFKDL